MSVNPKKALWEKGDFTRIAESMRESGEAIQKHATRADLPITEIIPIADTVVARPDPAPAEA